MATIVLGLRLLLAVVFMTAGVGKLLDLEGSRRAMRDFRVPEGVAGIAGTILPIVEILAAVALIFTPTARWGAALALVLLLTFITGIGFALARGEEPDCHCFGQIHSAPAGQSALIRNSLLAACAAVVVAYGSGPAVDAWVGARSAAVLVAIILGIWAVAATAYAITLRAQVRKVGRDLDVARQAAASGLPGLPVGVDAPRFALKDLEADTVTLDSLLDRGKPLLLMFMTPWCGPCSSLAPRVQEWQQALGDQLTIAVVSSGKPEQNESFLELGLEDVLLQDNFELADQYRVTGTPSAMLIGQNGKIASNPGETAHGIEPLVRLALRQGVGSPLAGSAA